MSSNASSDHFNKLGARKEIGAIRHRIKEAGLDPDIQNRIVRRHIANLAETLPAKFENLLFSVNRAAVCGEYSELLEGLIIIESLIPLTYGAIPAGTAFRLPGGGIIAYKRKGGVELAGPCHPHLDAGEIVIVVNI